MAASEVTPKPSEPRPKVQVDIKIFTGDGLVERHDGDVQSESVYKHDGVLSYVLHDNAGRVETSLPFIIVRTPVKP